MRDTTEAIFHRGRPDERTLSGSNEARKGRVIAAPDTYRGWQFSRLDATDRILHSFVRISAAAAPIAAATSSSKLLEASPSPFAPTSAIAITVRHVVFLCVVGLGANCPAISTPNNAESTTQAIGVKAKRFEHRLTHPTY